MSLLPTSILEGTWLFMRGFALLLSLNRGSYQPRPHVSPPVRHSQALLHAEKHWRQKSGALGSPRSMGGDASSNLPPRAFVPRSSSPRNCDRCGDPTIHSPNVPTVHLFCHWGEQMTFGPPQVGLSKMGTPHFGVNSGF